MTEKNILLFTYCITNFNYVCPNISYSLRKLCFRLIKQLSGIFFREFVVIYESNNGFQGFVNINKVLCALYYQHDQYTCLMLRASPGVNPLFNPFFECYTLSKHNFHHFTLL